MALWVVLEDFESGGRKLSAGTLIDDVNDFDVPALLLAGLSAVLWDNTFETLRQAFLSGRASRPGRVDPTLWGTLLRSNFGASMVGTALGDTVEDALSIPGAPFIEGAGGTTVSLAFEDIAGIGFNVTLTRPARIQTVMTIRGFTSGAGGDTVGRWTVQIDGVDNGEMGRTMAGLEEGSVTVQARHPQAPAAALPAGVYVIQGRHRRLSGPRVIESDFVQLSAVCVPP